MSNPESTARTTRPMMKKVLGFGLTGRRSKVKEGPVADGYVRRTLLKLSDPPIEGITKASYDEEEIKISLEVYPDYVTATTEDGEEHKFTENGFYSLPNDYWVTVDLARFVK